ncbi:MAG TPA: DNA repair protein RadC [Candidatus Saccharimonadales bacterium]|nr:DNA repair protein RadC [Candidatus Saccharimonadales bacterium]
MASKYRRITELPVADRPREKLQRKGAQALSDFELLEVMVGNGNGRNDVGAIARQLQRALRSNEFMTLESLTSLRGVNTAQAGKLLAALEIAKRHLVRNALPVRTQEEILGRLAELRSKQQEHFVCLSLDGGQRLIAQRTVTIGTLDTVLAHPREVFSDPIVERAASILVAHNHPSDEAEPSEKDVALTQQLIAAGQLLGIPLRDHIIITRTDHFSFKQHHMI